MHVGRAARGEVDDQVADELARPVVRRAAAARRLEHGYAARGERGAGLEQVGRIEAAPERDHGRMLEQQQRIGPGARAARFESFELRLQRFAPPDPPHPLDLERGRHG